MPSTDQTMTADDIRTMTIEDFLARCESDEREASDVLVQAGL